MILISRIVLQIHPKFKNDFKNSSHIPLLLSYLSYNFGKIRKHCPLIFEFIECIYNQAKSKKDFGYSRFNQNHPQHHLV